MLCACRREASASRRRTMNGRSGGIGANRAMRELCVTAAHPRDRLSDAQNLIQAEENWQRAGGPKHGDSVAVAKVLCRQDWRLRRFLLLNLNSSADSGPKNGQSPQVIEMFFFLTESRAQIIDVVLNSFRLENLHHTESYVYIARGKE